mmetsp:Transcript_9433/g.40862  ORF Transcript_9433/g.40862 Transcript_9433/m.40862 type:complete len:305 (+) Transcript_9433:240-1154(+)
MSKTVQKRFRQETGTLSKMDTSPVTVADFAVQALILSELDDGTFKFIAEETSAQLKENSELLKDVTDTVNSALPGRPALSENQICGAIDLGSYAGGDSLLTWVLDPVDGTKGFMRMEQYCIALGLLDRGKVVLGVLGCPNLPFDADETGCIFYAQSGSGAFCVSVDGTHTPRQIKVSAREDVSTCRFMESVESAHSSFEQSAKVASILGVKEPPLRMDSQCKYGALARGDGQIYMRFPRAGYEENIWDHAAGSIVIEEAGGTVTDGIGHPLDFGLGRKMKNEGGIVATNGVFHEAVICAVKEVL